MKFNLATFSLIAFDVASKKLSLSKVTKFYIRFLLRVCSYSFYIQAFEPFELIFTHVCTPAQSYPVFPVLLPVSLALC